MQVFAHHFHQGTFKFLVLSMWHNLDFPILADAKADPGDVEVAVNRPSGGNKKGCWFLQATAYYYSF